MHKTKCRLQALASHVRLDHRGLSSSVGANHRHTTWVASDVTCTRCAHECKETRQHHHLWSRAQQRDFNAHVEKGWPRPCRTVLPTAVWLHSGAGRRLQCEEFAHVPVQLPRAARLVAWICVRHLSGVSGRIMQRVLMDIPGATRSASSAVSCPWT